MMIRSFLAALFLIGIGTLSAQTPGTAEFHRPSSFDNSFAGTIPTQAASRTGDGGRYGFMALFEIRVAPGVVKVLDVRQFFPTEQLAVQGFMRVQSAMPDQAILASVTWLGPTEGQETIGQ